MKTGKSRMVGAMLASLIPIDGGGMFERRGPASDSSPPPTEEQSRARIDAAEAKRERKRSREAIAIKARATRWAARNQLSVDERLREQSIAQGVCPCQSEAEEPGPHIASCRWNDPNFDGLGP